MVGGLSGLSYDPESRLYYIISDDRSAKNPARFYTARITLSDNGIDRVEFVATHPWLDPTVNRSGRWTSMRVRRWCPLTPRASPFDGRRQRLYWSSEGERVTDDPNGPVLLDPSVRIATLDGGFVGEFTLPPCCTCRRVTRDPGRTEGSRGSP